MSQERLQQARQLIKDNKLSEARQILEKLDHPTARQWIKQIDTQLTTPISIIQEENKVKRVPRKPSTPQEIIVTTVDLPYDYDVISPIYFQVSNKGLFSSSLSKLKNQYEKELAQLRKQSAISKGHLDLGFIWYGEFSVGQNDFEVAFFVSIRELQNRAAQMNADAVVGMRQDIDLDTSGWQFFYLQMYGTAVRFT